MIRFRRRTAIGTAAALVLLLPGAAGLLSCGSETGSGAPGPVRQPPSPPGMTARFERGNFSEFNEKQALNGSLRVTSSISFDGSRSAQATVRGGRGNRYARVIHDVSWREGDQVWYGAAFFLPRGFKRSMQGEVALIRWDDYRTRAKSGHTGGVVLWGSDKQAHLVRSRYRGHDTQLVGGFSVPEGRWFSLLVQQRLDRRSGRAYNAVYVDGLRAGSSTAANMIGRKVDTLRFGIVAVNPFRQRSRLRLWFDRCFVTGRPQTARGAGPAGLAWLEAPQLNAGLHR